MFSIFPKGTVPLGKQILDESKLLFIEVFQLTDEEDIQKLEYLHFKNPD